MASIKSSPGVYAMAIKETASQTWYIYFGSGLNGVVVEVDPGVSRQFGGTYFTGKFPGRQIQLIAPFSNCGHKSRNGSLIPAVPST